MEDIITRCLLVSGSCSSLGNDKVNDFLERNRFSLDKLIPITGNNPVRALAILKDQKGVDKLSKTKHADFHFEKFLTIENAKPDFCAIELSKVITELARGLHIREMKQKLQRSYTTSDGGQLVFGDLYGIMSLASVLTEEVEEYLQAVYNAEFGNCENSPSQIDTKIDDIISQSVVVTGFPEGTSKDKIKIALQRKKDGGGEVECIHPVGSLEDSAIAIFSDRHVVDNLKAKGIMNSDRFPDHQLQIKSLTDYGNLGSQYILVRGFTKYDNIESTKNKLTINLQMQSVGGGDVKMIIVGQAQDIALVEFDNNSVSGRLLQKKTITANDGNVIHFGKSLVKFAIGCVIGKVSEYALQVFPEIKDTLNEEEGKKWKCIAPNEYLFYTQDSLQELKDLAAKCIKESCIKGMEGTYRQNDVKYPPTNENEVHSEGMLPQQMITEEQETGRLSSSDVTMSDKSSTFEVCQIEDVEYNLLGETKVIIHHGDITDEVVDVIVNAANGNLYHGGGVAFAIAQKAGPEIEKEGNDIIRERGCGLQVGDVVVTKGYNLKAWHVIHAVGPNKWESRNTFRSDLLKTFSNCLEHANTELNAKSVALPLISAGLYGGDLQECAEELANALIALRNYYKKGKQVGLKEIRIVDNNINVALTIQDAFKIFTSEKARQAESCAAEEDMEGVQGEEEGGRATGVCQPSAASEKVKCTDVENTKCCLCKNPARKKFILNCNHVLCTSCLSTIRKNLGSKKCPQCKRKMSDVELEDQSFRDDKLQKHLKNSDGSSSRGRCTQEEGERDSTPQEKDTCVICLDDLSDDFKELKCKHKFCKDCINQAFKVKPVCPSCGMICGEMKGNQPPGTMNTSKRTWDLPDYAGHGTIEINYQIPSGIQTEDHPNPGKRFQGTHRTAYLPNNPEGKHVAELLRKAFDAGLIFTVGTSTTSGSSNVVTWNDIHHKTNSYGGPERYGYPDQTYLKRVKAELAAKGIE